MRRALFLAVFLLAGFPGGAVRADEDRAPQLRLEDLFGGGRRFTRELPAWSWRPGHAQLVRLAREKVGTKDGGTAARRFLETLDPVSGKREELLDLTALEALVPGKAVPMRGIGRRGPPTHVWRQDGKALCAVVKGDLVWVDLEAGTRRRLTRTETPLADLQVAPGGRHVSFSRDHELWVCPTEEGRPYPLTSGGSPTLLNGTLDWVYPEELGFDTAAWWAPDGRRIAYLQMDQADVPRYRVPGILPLRSPGREMFYPKAGDPNPKVRVGVVSVEGGGTTWHDLPDGAEYLFDVHWMPGARSRHERPFLVTGDRAQMRRWIRTPVGRSTTRVRDGWLRGNRTLRLLPEGRSIQRDAPGHARWSLRDWSVPGSATHRYLTPPGVEAGELLRLDPVSASVFYGGLVHGEHTRGVFVGGPGVEGIHRAPFARDPDVWTTAKLDDGGTYALVTRSTATTPPTRAVLRVKDGALVRDLGDASTPALAKLKLAVPEHGSLPVEGMAGRIRWRLWKPHDFDPAKRYGLIVHAYGGPGSKIVRNRWGRGPLFPTLLCDRGWLVLQADGRGTAGQGEDWLFSVKGRLGLRELEDQVAAVRAILARGYVDPERVGIWGWSYGGTMTCNALTMRSDVFKAGVAVAPVTDWRLYDSIYTERYMGLPSENEKGYEETSSVRHAKGLEGRLLLLHGLGDDNVHAQNTLRLVEALLEARNPNFDVMLYPRRGHGLEGAGLDVFRRLVAWFERHIGPR